MTLTQEQIEKLSKKLTKLSINNKEKLTKDLNSIIWYMDILNEVDTDWVEPTISVVDYKDALRKDEEQKKDVAVEELLACSEQKVIWNQIAVTNIMK